MNKKLKLKNKLRNYIFKFKVLELNLQQYLGYQVTSIGLLSNNIMHDLRKTYLQRSILQP